jgi:hypothetical protein
MSDRGTYCAGQLAVTTADNEMAPSQWVSAPHVAMTSTGEVCLDLSETYWDLARTEETPTGLLLILRKYPDSSREVVVSVDPASGLLSIGGKPVASSALERALDVSE